MIGDLAAFLAARLDEDETNARKVLAQWPDTHFMIDPGSLVIVEFHRRHGPARVLREVTAKRAILAAHEPGPWGEPHPELLRCTQGHGEEDGGYWTPWPCSEVQAVAAVYSDYDQDWKP